jgi:hypothetical protein
MPIGGAGPSFSQAPGTRWAFEAWAEAPVLQRTDVWKAEATELRAILAKWFAELTIAMDCYDVTPSLASI